MNTTWILLCAGLVSLVLSAVLEKKFIPFLMRIKMGQTILEIGPRWHKSKEGTPTMGGIFFIAAICASCAIFWFLPIAREARDVRLWKTLAMMVLYGAVGFIDDFVKFVKKRNKGLTALQKLVLQFAIAAGYLYWMRDSLETSLALPFSGVRVELGAFYWVFAILFIAFITNAVNLTDGIDGLAAGNTLVFFAFFCALAFRTGDRDQVILSSAVCGGMIGFLLYNYYPARVFMGDTGSLFLGGAVAGMAFWLNNPLFIVICGLVYIWEALSVVIQVVGFKLTKKRVFRMAPFHHHLEMCGWKETQIVAFAVFLTALLCAAALWMFR